MQKVLRNNGGNIWTGREGVCRRRKTKQEREAGAGVGGRGRRPAAHTKLESLDFNLWAMGSC